jgi:two-component system chemotaxis sensor kinase CheA
MSLDMTQFHQVFFEETQEHLENMESLLLELDVANPEPEQLNAIFRAAHSIKGSSGTFGFTDLQDVTHVLENLLDLIRKGELPLKSEMVDAFLGADDVLKDMLGAHRGGPAADPAAIASITARLKQLTVASESVHEDPGFGLFDEPAPLPAADRSGQDASEETAYGLFDDPQPAVPPTPTFQAEAQEAYGFFTDIPAATPEPAVAASATAAAPTSPTPPASAAAEKPPARERKPQAAAPAGSDASIRVGVDKVDQLINLVGELVITQAMLAQSALGADPIAFERLHSGLVQLERNTRDLQESVMSIRMMPMSVVFSRFPRVVRDLSQKLGKQVELKTSGETTELDKGLVERITDPLTHLIRNSLDHGIETPEARAAKGKPPVGTITLKAYHQSGNVVIEVGDDGAGLPRDKILAKAKERGLNVHDQMSDQEVFALIFEAGFSTADQITEVSGRGVGMDVVKRNIAAMGGRVEIDSLMGVGTRITVRLPLTLAILDGMSVAAGEETYIIPLGYVIESLQPERSMIRSLSGQERLIHVRGEYLPVVALHELFGLTGACTHLDSGIAIIVEADGARAALFVDALVGQHQVVIKSLEANYRKVSGVAGATIMGDGHVALILDVAALVQMARRHAPDLPQAA